jgi:hypothetical protein
MIELMGVKCDDSCLQAFISIRVTHQRYCSDYYQVWGSFHCHFGLSVHVQLMRRHLSRSRFDYSVNLQQSIYQSGPARPRMHLSIESGDPVHIHISGPMFFRVHLSGAGRPYHFFSDCSAIVLTLPSTSSCRWEACLLPSLLSLWL